MILFSVLIPHYNSSNTLKRLLKSIPVDSSVELIVIDDKSSEDLTDVVNLVLSRGGIFLYNTTSQKGAGVCRNLGLKAASGKWLVFADADDYFLDDAFDIMRQHLDSNADIIHFIPTSIDIRTGNISSRHIWFEKLVQRYLAEPTEENELMLRYRYMVPWSKMVRRSMIQDAGILFDEVIVSNDVMFSARCGYYAKKIEASDEKIYCVTQSEGTLTTKRDEAAFRVRAAVYRDKYRFIKEHIDLKKHGYVMPLGIQLLIHALQQGYSVRFTHELFRYFRRERVPLINRADILYILRHKFKERYPHPNAHL